MRSAETGEVIAELPNVVGFQFLWLDDRTAAYVTMTSSGLSFIDFDNAAVATTNVAMMLGRVVAPLETRTIAPVKQAEMVSLRTEYAYPLNKLALINDRRLMLLDQLPEGQSKPLTQWRAEQLQLVTDRKLERLNPQNPNPSGVGLMSSSVSESAVSPVLANLVSGGAQVEGVGVYEAANGHHRANDHQSGTIEVEVRRSSRPIVLVLTSYEPVHWKLNRQPGASARCRQQLRLRP